jgi:hypothetical protein
MTSQDNASPSFVNNLPASERHPVPTLPRTNEGIRVCQVIGLKPEALEEYKKVHEEVFEGVLKALRRAGVVGELKIILRHALHLITLSSRLLHSPFRTPVGAVNLNRFNRKFKRKHDTPPHSPHAVYQQYLAGRLQTGHVKDWRGPGNAKMVEGE